MVSLLGLSACIGSTVSNLFITGVKLTPANPTIPIGATQQFQLTATYLDGQTTNVTNHSTYASDNQTVATVSKSGLATPVAVGTANILASYNGNNTKTLLTVAAAVATVAISAQGDSRVLQVTNLRTGQRMTFAANALADSVTISRDGENNPTELSVLPEHGPNWLAIDPSGNYLYVVNQTSESISAFIVNWKTGGLEPIVSSPFRTDAKPSSVEVDADGAGLSLAHFPDSAISRFRIDPATGALTTDPQ